MFFIFSILFVFLFKDIKSGDVLDDSYINFSNFFNAFLTLFRCSTGEDWINIMFDTMKVQTYYSLFFVSFIVIC